MQIHSEKSYLNFRNQGNTAIHIPLTHSCTHFTKGNVHECIKLRKFQFIFLLKYLLKTFFNIKNYLISNLTILKFIKAI